MFAPEIKQELHTLLIVVLDDVRAKLDRGIRTIMDSAIEDIKDLVEVRINPERTNGLDITITYPLAQKEAK